MNILKSYFKKDCDCKEEKLLVIKKVRNIINNYMKSRGVIMDIYLEKAQCTNEDVIKIWHIYKEEKKEIQKKLEKLEKKITEEMK